MTMTAMFLFRFLRLFFYCIVYIVSISALSLCVCMHVCIMYYANPATGCHIQ